MTTDATLTVAFPTYNRRDAIEARLSELRSSVLDEGVRVLVVDNASPDDTDAHIRHHAEEDSRITIRRNDRNLGYAGNVLRILEVADTDYVTIVSDEDRIDPDGLGALLRFCREARPSFVSPRAQVATDDAYRGRRESRPIAPAEFESSAFYMSGLTFDVRFIQAHAQLVSALIPDNSAATVYPQVLLAAAAIAEGQGWFLDALVSVQADMLPSHITDPSASAYNVVPGRWAQFLGYESYFAERIAAAPGGAATAYAQMRDAWRSRLYPLLLDAAEREAPGITSFLDAAARERGRPGMTAKIRQLLSR